MQLPTLVVIAGPTAVGKTSVAIEVAKHFKTEIVNADSRQFYKEMHIGTAVPSQQELDSVEHHFVQSHSIQQPISAGFFEDMALNRLKDLFKVYNLVVLTGGSGLFIDAVIKGFDSDMPEADEALRKELEVLNISDLQIMLKEVDPEYYKKVDLNNPHRLIRAIEVCKLTGSTYTSLRGSHVKERPFRIVKVCLQREREELYDRINLRVDKMIEEGLEKEARGLYPHKELKSLQTVGYAELFKFFDGEINKDEAIELIKRNSRRYAKRQLTWIRRDGDYRQFGPNELINIINYISDQL